MPFFLFAAVKIAIRTGRKSLLEVASKLRADDLALFGRRNPPRCSTTIRKRIHPESGPRDIRTFFISRP